MMKKLIGAAALVAVAFAGGNYFGKTRSAPVLDAAAPGESYQGGFRVTESFGANRVAVPSVEGDVIVVEDGDSIQDAVNRAKPGDTIRVMPGSYVETVYIDKDSIRLIGVIEEGVWPTLEGETRLNDAILYSGNNIVVENFKITHYKGNGIMGQAGNNFEIRNNLIVDTGVYGIFPQLGQNGIVVGNIISGI
ncbi:MAG: right-handed parallel beta-helix repeat-containing protein [Pseudomonadota bacterium]